MARSRIHPPALAAQGVSVWYGASQILHEVTLSVPDHAVTAIIGPSGCGKSTFLRCLNRMNDFIPSFRATGSIEFRGRNLLDPTLDATTVRFQIGMVFQKPNPFPASIYDNVAFGPRVNGLAGDLDTIVETALRQAGLWEEVEHRLRSSALALSGGQQQRLCIARAIAVGPEVILMDEPCASLDPIATERIESLIRQLRRNYAVVIVTHNLQQAARVSDQTAFLLSGRLIEAGPTKRLFTRPTHRETDDYIRGRFG